MLDGTDGAGGAGGAEGPAPSEVVVEDPLVELLAAVTFSNPGIDDILNKDDKIK